jgi:hypothetical protein
VFSPFRLHYRLVFILSWVRFFETCWLDRITSLFSLVIFVFRAGLLAGRFAGSEGYGKLREEAHTGREFCICWARSSSRDRAVLVRRPFVVQYR